jgi:hypothetical protein
MVSWRGRRENREDEGTVGRQLRGGKPGAGAERKEKEVGREEVRLAEPK